MALFPLATPLEGLNLITTACHLYRQSLWRILPLSIAFAVIMHLFQDGHSYFPEAIQAKFHAISMFLIVFTLPILAGYIVVIDLVSKGKTFTYSDVIAKVVQGFVALMAVLISMLLIPAIIFAVITGIHLIMLSTHTNFLNIYVYRTLLAVVVYFFFTSKIYAPVLVFTDNLDSNSALDLSDTLVKGDFLKTFLYSLYGGAFFVAILTFSLWLPLIIPTAHLNPLLIDVLGQIIVAVLGSWTFALWLTMLADNQSRKIKVNS